MIIQKLIIKCIFAVLICCNLCNSQIKREKIKIGLSYGSGSQNRFPFDLKDYTHTTTFYKAHFNYTFKEKKKWAFEFTAEPSYNIVEHQLLNKWFIKPTDGDNYLEKRDLYTQKRTFREYVLNLGLIARYPFYKSFSAYAVGSVGPMISDGATERLARGFAFSDVFGLGLSYDVGRVRLDFRYSVRHTSNLETKHPNNGHNTTNTEFSILFNL